MEIFEVCHNINDLILSKKHNEARDELIKLLDYHNVEDISYSPLVNNLIRQTGLYPYIDQDTADWQERFIYEAFKVDIGDKEEITLHREQSNLLKKLLEGKSLAVSAPTSFGKSFIIDSFISIKKPSTVAIIVPTIALTDETRRRLYRKFSNEYKIITTSEEKLSDKNIFIFPQERAINYINTIEKIDLFIVDEFYKASTDFEKERSPALIKAIMRLGDKAIQKYFLAPNISHLNDNPFTENLEFIKLDFNTVFLEKHELYNDIKGDDKIKSSFLLDILSEKKTKTLIYAGTYSEITKVTNLLIENLEVQDSKLLNSFSDWLEINYDANWSLTSLIKRATGVHNGRLHRSLSQIQVKLFEELNGLDNLISTSSIIEGVNTSAENVVIWRNKIGGSNLNDFTYKNIIGRGGRMFKHFVGKIFILEEPPTEENTQLNLTFPDELLGELDENEYADELNKEQISQIIRYKEDMKDLLGSDVFNRIHENNELQITNTSLIRDIAYDLVNNQIEWRSLKFLNSENPNNWDNAIYKIIKLQPGGWDIKYSSFVEFVKALSVNWTESIPRIVRYLYQYDIDINKFFQLERTATFKLASLAHDINVLQKEIFLDGQTDISPFVSRLSHAFLPSVVFQLEEYGLPRMISKKIHQSNLINMQDPEISLHDVIERIKSIGYEKMVSEVDNLHHFDKYILEYFYSGISTQD
jgi:hypothetical protein